MEISIELPSSVFFLPIQTLIPDHRVPIALELILIIVNILSDESVLAEHINGLIFYLCIEYSNVLRIVVWRCKIIGSFFFLLNLDRYLYWDDLVVYDIVVFVELNQMALVHPLANQDEGFWIYQFYGLSLKLERQKSYKLFIQV
jgi:hypothetical protein